MAPGTHAPNQFFDARNFGGAVWRADCAPAVRFPALPLGQASIEVFSVHVLCCLAGHALSEDADPTQPWWQQAILLIVTISALFLTALASRTWVIDAGRGLMTLMWPLFFSFIVGYGLRIVHTYPHDRSSFTQGLEYRDGLLYEGTGLKGQSRLRVERLETGQIVRQMDVPAEYFGEGITVFGNRIFQLTWQSQVGFVYGRSTFRLLGSFIYPGEGWGSPTMATMCT